MLDDGLRLTPIAIVGLASAQPFFLRLLGGLVIRWSRTRRNRLPFSPDHQAFACLAGIIAGSAFGGQPPGLALGLGLLLAQLILLDCRYLWLPRRLTLPLLAAGLVAAAFDNAALTQAAAGAAAGFLVFATLRMSYRRLRGKDGLGAGDVTLFAAIGAWVGIDLLAPIALLAVSLALAVTATLGRKARDRPIPFGAWLCIAFWIVWISAAGETPI